MVNRGNGFLSITGLILLNIYSIAIISSFVVGSILDFTLDNNYIPLVLGNYFLILGAVLTFISSIIVIKDKAATKM